MKIRMNQKGFTLIELLIVIAIIAILAAIAIPQFSAYRIKGFNASSESDIRNWKTTEEACNSSFFSYCSSGTSVLPAATPASILIGAAALPCSGPLPAATPLTGLSPGTLGAWLGTPFVTTRNPAVLTVDGAIGIGVGNNVAIQGDNLASASDANVSDRALLRAKHLEGDTEFGVDTDSTAIYWCKNPDWVKVTMGATATHPAANILGVDDYNPGVALACGGAPITTWIAL